MNALQTEVWHRIDAYVFDAIDSRLTFTARLARDNGWSPDFARRALQEYKKFVLLAMTAGHPVTPSDEVDQVWHLHLLYTHSYWEDFSHILGGPLHHGPTQGGALEGRKFNVWYENTLRSYEQVFAAAPPPDIWPESAKRFADAAHFRRINTHACWVVPKPILSMPLMVVAVVAPLAWLSGCGKTGNTHLSGILFIVFVLAAILLRFRDTDHTREKKSKDSDKNGGGCGGSSGDGGGSSGCGGGGGCGGCGGCGGGG